ncbi:hypothetical protein [Actinoplanes teichomyceticus]|uniref:hypothetical protein n=1 Tax=Actinoplanes teichomyceticus TaxID=1867 RepID=UPI001A5EA38A|nr:hypothetical protein [Actinoplanes teichomyceticus]GIF12808.1 hypothetical protein Ate01nite_28400 [Actinoplanes teichomyceticus]
MRRRRISGDAQHRAGSDDQARLERERLAALHGYRLFDTPPGEELRAVLRVAATVAGASSAALNLIGERR